MEGGDFLTASRHYTARTEPGLFLPSPAGPGRWPASWLADRAGRFITPTKLAFGWVKWNAVGRSQGAMIAPC